MITIYMVMTKIPVNPVVFFTSRQDAVDYLHRPENEPDFERGLLGITKMVEGKEWDDNEEVEV